MNFDQSGKIKPIINRLASDEEFYIINEFNKVLVPLKHAKGKE